MFNKIFRRGKTAKEDATPIPNYKNTIKSPSEYEYGPKSYNLNNKSPYLTSSNTTTTTPSSGPKKYTATNDLPPTWSNYDTTSKYDNSPANRSQNVYTLPPQKNLPYNHQNNNLLNNREYDKPFQQHSNNSSNTNQYPPSYKPNNLEYTSRIDKIEPSPSRYDTITEDRSPYIALGSTYSQSRPSYEAFKRDGSTNRNSNSQPGTPTATRREVYDPNSYVNRNVYRSTPNRIPESPQRDSVTNRPTFASPSRFVPRTYESPLRENLVNQKDIGPYNHLTKNVSETPTRSFGSSFTNQSSAASVPEKPKYINNQSVYNPTYNNNSDPTNSEYKPTLNLNSINSQIQAPVVPEPGKYIPYAIKKALKESQQAQQAKNDESKRGYNNSNINNINSQPSPKYAYTPYKPVYETRDISSNLRKSPYRNLEPSPYVELRNSKPESRNVESPGVRLVSPPIPPSYANRYLQKSYNEPPELPPKNIINKNKTTEYNRNFSSTPNPIQSPSPSNFGYYNVDSNENKSPYIPYSNQTSFSPSFKSPTPSTNDYINLSENPKSFSNFQPNTETTTRNQNVFGINNNVNTTTPDHYNGKQINNLNPNTNTINNFETASKIASNSYNTPATSNYKNTITNRNTTQPPNTIFPNENKFTENKTASNRATYEPQQKLYDTHQSYVQTPQYNYGSGERTTDTKTNTNAFDDWLPKNTSNLNENSSCGSTRSESKLWKREKDNANNDEFSSTAFGTVSSNLNANNYFNDKNNLINRNLNNDSSFKKDDNFDRYSTFQKQQYQPLNTSLNTTATEKLYPLSSSSTSTSETSHPITSPLLEASSISAATTNLSYQPKNDLDDDESESEPLSSSEQINETSSEETTKSKSPKKTVRFFNPIDKSRDFISDIMAKGRNRNKHRNNNNNNNKNSQKNSNNNGKNDLIKSPLIISNEVNSDLKDFEDIDSNKESEILKNFKNENNSNNKNNKITSESKNEKNSDKTGYQITKSKNSRDIVKKLQNTRAKLASPEDDESDNNIVTQNKNFGNYQKNKIDDDNTDNTDTETLDETFEDDDDDTVKISNISNKNNTTKENKVESIEKSQKENVSSACDKKINNIESSSEKSCGKNFQQQYQQHQVYHQQNSNLPSVNENTFDRNSRSSVPDGNSKFSSQANTSDTDFYANLKKHQTNNNNNNNNKNTNNNKTKNAEQIEKIEKLSELTECDRDSFIKTHSSMGQSQAKVSTSSTAPESPRLGRSRSTSPPSRTINKPTPLNSSDYAEIYKCSSQREREPVVEEPLSPTTPLSPTESCDQFYDLTSETTTTSNLNNPTIPLPKVTVADYSKDSHSSNKEPEIFYDFETVNSNFGKSPPKYPPPPPSPSAQFKSRSTSPIDIVALEDIEEEEDEDDWHFVSDNNSSKNNNNNTSNSAQQQSSTSNNPNYLSSPTLNRRNNSKPVPSEQQSSPILSRKSSTSPQKLSNFNYDDYRDGLNTPDSGIGGATTPISSTINSTTISSTSNSKVLVINSCDLVNDTDDIELVQAHQKQTTNNFYSNRNGNSNTIKFCENNNNSYNENNSEYTSINSTTSIVIDSISLPDVVIESKPKENESQNNNNKKTSLTAQNNDYVLNVSKSKSEGNVHFIPIHVEGREKPKIEIVEETTEFTGSNVNNTITDNYVTNPFNINNGFVEDISNQNNNSNSTPNITVVKAEKTNSYNSHTVSNNSTDVLNNAQQNEENKKLKNELQEKLKKTIEEKKEKEEELKRELVNQEARFNAQLQEAQQNASSAQERAHELQMKIDQLEQDISLKSWNIERLNGEIQAIQQEHTAVRRRLQTIEDEKERLRQQRLDDEDEYNTKYENLEEKYKELEEKYERLRHLATTLQTQLAHAKAEADELQIEKEKLCDEKEAELNRLQELLDKAIEERKELEIKWQKEFELLRNHNQEHEEQLLTDCEFQLRTMQKKCKERIENAEKSKQEVLERNSELEEKVAEGEEYSERLKNLQAEVRQLRGLTNEQRESISHMHKQIEELRTDLEAANNDLEKKIEEVRKIKLYCDNTLLFKDRDMIQKIDEASREVATIWEEKLLTEMTRLTNELEAVHSEERLSDMNKLQAEHIEELKVLTNRYTCNEEELRRELEEVTDKLQFKTSQYLELRDKTDTEILTTRIHLDKADREYQKAMNREMERKEELEEKLRKEFEEEKSEMEAKFEQRIAEIKEHFKKEMANQTHDIAQRHRQQLEQQWDQLVAEKEDALQTLEKRHKIKLEDQENRLRILEVQHKRDMKDLKEAYDLDRSALQNRDIHNSQELEQLHRKCRCLTNLFEEMRLRYERREPRPEDLREIDELRARCDSQERDLCELTERLREMQIQMEEMQTASNETQQQQNRKKQIRKPPPKQIPISCDVIYEEENEETESIGEELSKETTTTTANDNNNEINLKIGFSGEENNNSIHQNSIAVEKIDKPMEKVAEVEKEEEEKEEEDENEDEEEDE